MLDHGHINIMIYLHHQYLIIVDNNLELVQLFLILLIEKKEEEKDPHQLIQSLSQY